MNNLDNKKTELNDLLKRLDSIQFEPSEHIINSSDLPSTTPFKDYENELDENEALCMDIIDNIASNYILSDSVLASDKTTIMKREQAKKLAEMQFLVTMSRSALIKIQEALDAGDINPDLFRIHISYMKEMREAINDRSKHLQSVETYWSDQSDRLGIETTREEMGMDSDKEKNETEDTKKTMIAGVKDINDYMRKMMEEDNKK